MSVKSFLASMVAVVTLIVASVQGHAFMNQVTRDAEAKAAEAVTERVDALHEQMAGGEVECTKMLAQLDDLLKSVDQTLDAGVAGAEEETYLAVREEIVQMRVDLPCLGESSLVQTDHEEANELDEAEEVEESVLVSAPGEPSFPGGGSTLSGGASPVGSAYGGSGISGGGSAATAGMGGATGGGGGAFGGGGQLGLMSAAAAAAIAIPVATADDDDPGQPATEAGF